MPLNKLENFIKNTEGKILYVNPNDLDATDSITNQGNSLTKPFKTIQRAEPGLPVVLSLKALLISLAKVFDFRNTQFHFVNGLNNAF